MTAQSVFDQKVGQAAATAPLRKSLLLEAAHDTTWQRDIEPFRVRGFGDLGGCDLDGCDFDDFGLQLLLQLLKKAF